MYSKKSPALTPTLCLHRMHFEDSKESPKAFKLCPTIHWTYPRNLTSLQGDSGAYPMPGLFYCTAATHKLIARHKAFSSITCGGRWAASGRHNVFQGNLPTMIFPLRSAGDTPKELQVYLEHILKIFRWTILQDLLQASWEPSWISTQENPAPFPILER